MKKLIVTILSLVVVFSLSVCAFATQSFDPTLDIEKSADGKTITVTMNDLPDGVSAELIIPCAGWDDATVKDSTGKTVVSTFGKVDNNPNPEVEQLVDAVTFDAVGGTYTITKGSAPSGGNPGGYYPVVTPDKDTTEEKPTESKPITPAQPTTPPVVEDNVTPEPEDTTPVVPDEPPVIDDGAVDEAPADDVTQPSGGNAGLWIGIGIVALAAIVVVLAIMAVRKKRK